MAAPDPFRSPFVGENPIQRAQRIQRKQSNWRNTVLRRQRILKARGYNVPVDGNWGKRTSSAWWRLNRNLPPLAGRKLPAALPGRGEDPADKAVAFQPKPPLPPRPAIPALPSTQLQTVAQKAVARARAKAVAARNRKPLDLSHASARAIADMTAPSGGKKLAIPSVVLGGPDQRKMDEVQGIRTERAAAAVRVQAEQRFTRAWAKKDTPEKWDTRDVVAIFGDPTTRVRDWQNKPRIVGKLQRWLNAHGADIAVTGMYDRFTADALATEMERRKRNYNRWRATQIVRHFYHPLGIKPGQAGFPALGKAPTPEQLLKIADEGGFTSQFIFKVLGQQLYDLNSQSAFRQWQDEFLDELLVGGKGTAQARSAFGPFLSPIILDEMTLSQKYAAVILGMSSIGQQQAEATGQGFSVENDPEKKGDTFYEQVRAVAESTSEAELKQRVFEITAADEKVFQAIQAMRGEGGGLGGLMTRAGSAIVHALAVPSETAQDVGVDIYAGLKTYAGLVSDARKRGQVLASPQELSAQLADERSQAHAAYDQWEKDHAVLGFGVDLVVDPLNLVPGTWVADAWRGTKAGVKAVEAAGEITRTATRTRSAPVRLLGEATGGALQLAPSYLRGVQAGVHVSKSALKESKAGRLFRTVKEQVDRTSEIVQTGFYHGFQPSLADDPVDLAETRDYVRKIVEGLEATDPTTGRTFNILEELEKRALGAVDEMTNFFTDFVNLSSRRRHSLYTHKNKLVPSDYGAAHRAAFADFARVMEVDKGAAEAGLAARKAVLDEIHASLADNQEFRSALARYVEALKGNREGSVSDDALRQVREEYQRFIRQGKSPTPGVPLQPHRIPTIREAQQLPMTDEDFVAMIESAANSEYERAYAKYHQMAGTHMGGGSYELNAEIEKRVQDHLDLYNKTLAPALQSAIERSLDNFEQKLIDEGARPTSYKKRTLFTETGDYAFSNRSGDIDLLRDVLRDTFDDLDVKYGPRPDKAGDQKVVHKLRDQLLKDLDEDFDHRFAALDEKQGDLASVSKVLRENLLGEHTVELHPVDGGEPLVAARQQKPDGKLETVEEAAARFLRENRYDPAQFEAKPGISVRKHPVLINKKDKAVIFGGQAEELLARARAGEADLSGFLLGEARVGPTGQSQSLAEKIVDLETGELKYDPKDFADQVGSKQADAKFQKAIKDLSAIDKRIAALERRRKDAGRAHTADAKAHGWTAQDQADLDAQRRAKRLLIKNNPATETYFVRGAMKRGVTRHVRDLLDQEVGGTIEDAKAALRAEKSARRAEIEREVADFAETQADTRATSRVFIRNTDNGRVFTQDEYDGYVAMMYDRRVRSISQWAARRRAVGDLSKARVDEIVEKELDDYAEELKGRFHDNGDGSFTMDHEGVRVPAIYARGHLSAYGDALKGRHPVLTAADVPDDVKRILSVAGTPADRPTGSVQAMERLAALVSGSRPYPVWKKFGEGEGAGVVKGRKLTFERGVPNRVGVAQGTRMADKVRDWGAVINDIRGRGFVYASPDGSEPTDFVGRYQQYRGLLKVASEHAYPHVTLRQGAVVRALKEAQSGPLKEISNTLDFFRELFVFSVLPGRPGALLRNVFDSVVKIAVIGMHDPRYWFISGATDAEIASRKAMKQVSKTALSATLDSEIRAVQKAVEGYHSAMGKAGEMLDDTALASMAQEVKDDVLSTVTNFWQLGINDLEQALRLMVGPKYADAAAATFRHVMNTGFWARPLREVRDALRVNGVKVPDEAIIGVQTLLKDGVDTKMIPREKVSLEDWAAINGVKDGDVAQWVKDVTANPKLLNETRHPVAVMVSHLSNVSWDLMVGRPEGRLRRGLYNAAYAKTFKRTGDSTQAMTAGMKAIDKSLFDYSKQTVLDENLRHLIPFYFFWRRNLGFWATQSIQKPYLPASLVKFDQMMENAHSDQPEWARRYLRLPFLNDTLAKLPVAGWILGASSDGFEVGTDPLSWISAAPLYRAFKGQNPLLPADKAGLPFISGLVEGMNDFGLSMSPWFRKPAELAGLFDYRAWQQMFPQTAVVDVFTERFLHEMFPNGLNIEEVLQDGLWEAMGKVFEGAEELAPSKLNEKRINEWVQLEMAAQAARGEPVDRAAAEKKVRQFVYLQTVFAFASGAFLRHLDPAQLHLYNIQTQLVEGDVDFLDDLSPQEKKAYSLFVRRKMNPAAYDHYVKTIPTIEGFYAIEGDWEQSQDYLNRHPEVIPYVSPERTGKPAFRNEKKAMRNISLITETGATLKTLKVFDDAGIDEPGVRETLQRHFVTPELQAFWARNDTPRQRRDRMLKGEVYGYLRGLRGDYFDIPEKDHAARSQFLQDNPLLAHSFTVNERASDDLKDVLNAVNSDLREAYFEFVDKKDYEGASEFLKRFPRIFEFTKAADRVTDDGTWLPSKKGSQHAKDYLAAKRFIEHYFALRTKNKNAAYKWLNGSTPGAKLARAYFAKYADPSKGTKSEHARDYLKVKPLLSWFFDALPKKGDFRGHFSKWEWVFESKDPAAVALRNYFRKYGDKDGMSQHAKDYVAVKDDLQRYFKMKEEDAGKANDWLHSEAGKDVIAYFKKYGKTNAAARKWGSWVRSENPEVNRRLMFWKRYFELEPDQRPGFVHAQAENYGVFVWGPEADQDRHDREQAYLRAAKKRHLTKKSALYLKVKPLLELMHGLNETDTKILLRLNPDVREYLDTYGKGPQTGSKELDKKVSSYFALPPDSAERAAFLRKNPEVQDYFDEKNPADAAMHNLLEVYFQLPMGKERKDFGDLHPELSDYFERKREERDLLRGQLQVFDREDPRDAELRERAQFEIVHAAEVMWAKLRRDGARRLAGDDIQVRRERDEKAREKRRLTL